jgi:hypothetical protein
LGGEYIQWKRGINSSSTWSTPPTLSQPVRGGPALIVFTRRSVFIGPSLDLLYARGGKRGSPKSALKVRLGTRISFYAFGIGARSGTLCFDHAGKRVDVTACGEAGGARQH